MADCQYYRHLNGGKGQCLLKPPVLNHQEKWAYPLVGRGCHCMYFVDGNEPKPMSKTAKRKAVVAKNKAI